tara:strand:+ start:296 stop:514 length:219 start_codon:yes stop_codon:yes gene_type:complete
MIDLSYMVPDMTERNIKRTNPYSGQSEMLTEEEAKLYDQIKLDEELENYTLVQKGLSMFSRMNAKAYMTLLD